MRGSRRAAFKVTMTFMAEWSSDYLMWSSTTTSITSVELRKFNTTIFLFQEILMDLVWIGGMGRQAGLCPTYVPDATDLKELS